MTLGVDGPLQRIHDMAEMLAHGGLAGVRIPAGERLDDHFVLAQ